MRTISEPARLSAATWRTVASTSAVSVLVIDCTTMGAPPPTVTLPTCTGTLTRRGSGAAESAMEFPSPKQGLPEHGARTSEDGPEEPEYSDEKAENQGQRAFPGMTDMNGPG